MLVNLHVKNFAIIDQIDVDFGKHLNILTGETGAGKSIVIGSIGIALGARVSPEMIGKNGEYAMVEIVFHIEDKETMQQLRELDVELEDGQIVISRKIMENRSINKINGTTVSVSLIRRVAALCIDIHGQHEHQSLLRKERHLEIVDEYAGKPCAALRERIGKRYKDYKKLEQELSQETMSAEERARQKGFLEYEKQEIEAASLQQGEIEQIDETYRLASRAGVILETLNTVHQLCSETAGGAVSRGLQHLQGIADTDATVSGLLEELLEIESLLGDFNREISAHMSDVTFDENELRDMERRLDCIHNLQNKYGRSYEEIMEHLRKVDEKLLQLDDYESYCQTRREQLGAWRAELEEECAKLTELRRKSASQLQKKIAQALEELNFAHVDFEISLEQKENITADGWDDIEFRIATNPGEPRRSLGKIVSGGELSRIMLAIKSVFADTDHIETLIFDEIDAGISGRTAQKVSEKMSLLGSKHQVICITHLAQIAAMADTHFVIEKAVSENQSLTQIRPLEREEMEEELARILGGMEITEAVRQNAKEMKVLADSCKSYMK